MKNALGSLFALLNDVALNVFLVEVSLSIFGNLQKRHLLEIDENARKQ